MAAVNVKSVHVPGNFSVFELTVEESLPNRIGCCWFSMQLSASDNWLCRGLDWGLAFASVTSLRLTDDYALVSCLSWSEY